MIYLKRGEKLNLETAQTDMDGVDNGLRYDLKRGEKLELKGSMNTSPPRQILI